MAEAEVKGGSVTGLLSIRFASREESVFRYGTVTVVRFSIEVVTRYSVLWHEAKYG